MRKAFLSFVLLSGLSVGAAPLVASSYVADADVSSMISKFQVSGETAVPGAVLKSGSYIIRVVDRLTDRSILQVESEHGKVISTFLAVPNRSLAGSGGQGPVAWTGGSAHAKALRGFNFPGEYSAEFVYPKAEAVKIATGHSAAVEAIDPPSDNLPSKQKSLTPDDMRIVTLWTLSPTRVNGSTAIAAEKYKPAETTSASQPVVARNEPPAGLPQPSPSANSYSAAAPSVAPPTRKASVAPSAAKTPARHPIATALPHTGSDLPSILLAGLVSLGGIVTLRTRRLFVKG